MSLDVTIIPSEDSSDGSVPMEKEDGMSEGTFGSIASEPDEGQAFIILLRGKTKDEDESKEEKDDEDENSFKKMFEDKRSKVISKANGECCNGNLR